MASAGSKEKLNIPKHATMASLRSFVISFAANLSRRVIVRTLASSHQGKPPVLKLYCELTQAYSPIRGDIK